MYDGVDGSTRETDAAISVPYSCGPAVAVTFAYGARIVPSHATP